MSANALCSTLSSFPLLSTITFILFFSFTAIAITYIPELAVPLMIVIGTNFGIYVCIKKIFILQEENKCMWNKKLWCDDLFFIILCWFFSTWCLKLELESESESYNTDFIKILQEMMKKKKYIPFVVLNSLHIYLLLLILFHYILCEWTLYIFCWNEHTIYLTNYYFLFLWNARTFIVWFVVWVWTHGCFGPYGGLQLVYIQSFIHPFIRYYITLDYIVWFFIFYYVLLNNCASFTL